MTPGMHSFSILERIDVGETITRALRGFAVRALSVSSNGSTWVKPQILAGAVWASMDLSVSSNGSTWVKLLFRVAAWKHKATFSILERIDVGET